MNKTSYKIIFYDEERNPVTIHAKNVYQSEILGFIEAENLIFPEPSEIIITPDDDKLRKSFKNAVKTIIPINMIIRIDEITDYSPAPVINIYNADKQS